MGTKIWSITGASRGFGRVWAEAALQRGDKVAAISRNLSSLNNLVEKYGDSVLPIQLDVSDKEADFAAINQAYQHFGRLDIVINNAAVGLFGAIEEAKEDEVRKILDINLLGALWITQAALPIMRKQGYGHIIQISSIGGITTSPTVGIYQVAKWGLEAFSETLAQEVKNFGIKVTIVEPSAYKTTDISENSVMSEPIKEYDPLRELLAQQLGAYEFGTPQATASTMLKIADMEEPPLRIFFGKYALPMAKACYADRMATWEKWKEISVSAQK